MKMDLVISTSLGILLGLIFVWVYSARELHREFNRQHPNLKLPVALLASRIASITLGVVVVIVSNVIIRIYQPTLLNVAIYLVCTLVVAIGVWKLILKMKGRVGPR